jgi:hypothetical protein
LSIDKAPSSIIINCPGLGGKNERVDDRRRRVE